MRTLLRVTGALLLLAVALFSVFGFMASYEYSRVGDRLPWQLGYGALGLACVWGAYFLVKRRPRISTVTAEDGDEKPRR